MHSVCYFYSSAACFTRTQNNWTGVLLFVICIERGWSVSPPQWGRDRKGSCVPSPEFFSIFELKNGEIRCTLDAIFTVL